MTQIGALLHRFWTSRIAAPSPDEPIEDATPPPPVRRSAPEHADFGKDGNVERTLAHFEFVIARQGVEFVRNWQGRILHQSISTDSKYITSKHFVLLRVINPAMLGGSLRRVDILNIDPRSYALATELLDAARDLMATYLDAATEVGWPS